MPSVFPRLIANSPSSPMASLSAVRALPGKGREGDRYFKGVGPFFPHPPKPDFEITLVEKEKIDAFASEAGLPFTASQARRNLVTEGVDLNAPGGKEFHVGEVRLRVGSGGRGRRAIKARAGPGGFLISWRRVSSKKHDEPCPPPPPPSSWFREGGTIRRGTDQPPAKSRGGSVSSGILMDESGWRHDAAGVVTGSRRFRARRCPRCRPCPLLRRYTRPVRP